MEVKTKEEIGPMICNTFPNLLAEKIIRTALGKLVKYIARPVRVHQENEGRIAAVSV